MEDVVSISEGREKYSLKQPTLKEHLLKEEHLGVPSKHKLFIYQGGISPQV
jgi:hypothetical protein